MPLTAQAQPAVDPSLRGVWRDGQILIVAHGARLPERCVKCNLPAVAPQKRRQVSWHHPALYLLILPGLLFYLLGTLFLSKKATVDPGLCVEHRKQRRWWIAAGWLGPVLGVAIAAASGGRLGVMSLGVAVVLGSVVAAMIQTTIVSPTRIDEGYAYLKGCGGPFLASVPETAIRRR